MISKEDLERWANDYGIAQALSVVGELARELIAAREELGRQHHGLMQTIEMQKERIEEREAERDAAIERAEKAEEKLAAQAPVTSAQPVTKTGHKFLDLLGLSFPAPVASEPSQPSAPEPPKAHINAKPSTEESWRALQSIVNAAFDRLRRPAGRFRCTCCRLMVPMTEMTNQSVVCGTGPYCGRCLPWNSTAPLFVDGCPHDGTTPTPHGPVICPVCGVDITQTPHVAPCLNVRDPEPPAASEPPRPPAEVWIVGVAPDMKPLTWAASEEESAKYGGGGAHVAGPYVLARPTASDEDRARRCIVGERFGVDAPACSAPGCLNGERLPKVADALAREFAIVRAEAEAKGRAAGWDDAIDHCVAIVAGERGEDEIRALAKKGGAL